MESKQNLNQRQFTFYDFMCLFVDVLRENEDFTFYLDELISFIYCCKTEKKFDKLLQNINFDDSFEKEIDDSISRLNGLIIRYHNRKTYVSEDFDNDEFFENIISKNMSQISDMFDFVDGYYEYIENNNNNNVRNDIHKVKII